MPYRVMLIFVFSCWSMSLCADEPSLGPVIDGYGPTFAIENRDIALLDDFQYKVVFDVANYSDDVAALNAKLVSVARFLNMHARNGVPQGNMSLAVVLHGAALKNVLNNDAYDPGPGWQLAWADEFEGDTLDPGKWRRQVVDAGKRGTHANMGAVATRLEAGKFADNFHVFEIEWDADSIQWFVDGKQFASTPISSEEFSEFHKPFFILLNIAVGGRSAGRVDETTRFPQTMYVDWVRVYQ